MLEYLFGAASFLPHGVCLLWRPDLVAIHVLSDIAVFAAYTSIAVMVFLFVSKRPEFKLDGVSTLFGMFVMGCGITHLAGAVTLWWPAYGLQGLIKLMVAIISVTAAIAVWRLMPALLAVPSGEDLRRQNDRLEREISERKRIETELRAKQDELVAALKRAEVADRSRATFLAAMSHDLRTPLNAIIGFADVLRLGVAGALATPKQQEYVEDICYSAQNLRGLIEDLLDVTKLENGIMALTPKQIPVNGLIEATMNEQRWVAEKENVALVYLPDPAAEAETRVMADHAALQRMLGNLISNALKFSPEGSAVTVRIEERSAETRIVVEDEGPGFPKGRLEDMKQPFVRGDDVVRRGCGLGLSIVDVLMLAHGGALDLQNRPEGGACVALVFPHVVARTNIEQFTPRKGPASSSVPKSLQVQFS